MLVSDVFVEGRVRLVVLISFFQCEALRASKPSFSPQSLPLELAGGACSMHYDTVLLRGQRGLSPSAHLKCRKCVSAEEESCAALRNETSVARLLQIRGSMFP